MSLHIIKPGLATRIVDAGRPHSRSLGVPVGGAADSWSLALGNALVGNPPEAAALEITLVGPTLRAKTDLACVLYGAPFELHSDRQRLTVGQTFTLARGETAWIGGTPLGARAYWCVQDGLQTPVILGSRSSLRIFQGGEELSCRESNIAIRSFAPDLLWRPPGPALRVLPGPQADWFSPREFYEQEYQIAPASDRMGLRILGRPLQTPRRELVSEPVAPGAIQVTPDGQCIILGMDGQTIGGYPKIAHVISADLPALGQFRPGDRLRFLPMDQEGAREAYQDQHRMLREWTIRARVFAGRYF